ncbi:GlcNac transferase [Achlya hypogyna]|uniref:GlcNac transferase n=1 Tax=Achlya hypogyna TaxID=1202772 RepID=A0A1V9ZNS1_ACHHY|nr:GlcNac transferase [Achlya hypogyna]
MEPPSFVWDRDVSHGGFTPGQTYTLDPASQNTPLDATAASYRPPPPQVPVTYDTFIGLPSYRDGKRCGFTIFTAFSRAVNPDRLVVGVVDQTAPGDAACVDEYCKLAATHWPEDGGDCRYRNRVHVDARAAQESTGPIGARAILHGLIRDEEFCLVMDSHMQFLPDWDTALVTDWARAENEMAVLSVYPTGFETIGPNLTPPVKLTRHNCYFAHESLPTIPDFGAILIDHSTRPQMGAFIGAGFQFSKCHAQTRVPLDARLKWVFLGEEFLRSMQLWTQGYDIYSPSRVGHVVFHDETPKDQTTLNGSYSENRGKDPNQATELELSLNRMRKQLHLPVVGPTDDVDIDKYYLPPVRSVEKYLNFSGVSAKDLALDRWPCGQLHWVPYDDPAPVEALLPGYSMTNPRPMAVRTPKPVVKDTSKPMIADNPVNVAVRQVADGSWEGLYDVYLLAAAVVVAVLAAGLFVARRRSHQSASMLYEPVAVKDDDGESDM